MNKDEHYMRRALDLAKLGTGRVSPNPLVGAVVVHNDQIIGEGWHREFGGPHAEVNALAAVKNPGYLRESTVYVTLEPCSHHGKTPPCSDLLIKNRIKRVVVGIQDPNPMVGGKGLERLRDAGINVKTDVLKDDCYDINRPFFIFHKRKRPFILLKWAQTADGFIARSDFTSKWISKPESRILVHKWRTECDAIMIGKNTALYDDPSLTVRDWTGHDPTRVVIDRNNELPRSLQVFTTPVPTLCYTRKHASVEESTEWVALGENMTLQDILTDMTNRGLNSVLVEGGATLLNSLMQADLWDEARIFVSDATFEEGISAPTLPLRCLVERIELKDTLYRYLNTKTDG